MLHRAGHRSGTPWCAAPGLALGVVFAIAGWGVPAAAEELPDLVIRAAEAVPLSSTKLRVAIANRGRAPAKATHLTLYYQRAGDVTRTPAPVPPLAAGETVWTTVDAGESLAAAARLTLRVDDPPAVTESDENNEFTVK